MITIIKNMSQSGIVNKLITRDKMEYKNIHKTQEKTWKGKDMGICGWFNPII